MRPALVLLPLIAVLVTGCTGAATGHDLTLIFQNGSSEPVTFLLTTYEDGAFQDPRTDLQTVRLDPGGEEKARLASVPDPLHVWAAACDPCENVTRDPWNSTQDGGSFHAEGRAYTVTVRLTGDGLRLTAEGARLQKAEASHS